MTKGVLISFEGSEGCGKSTQVEKLWCRLRDLGFAADITREPGGTSLGESIRHLLKFAPEGKAMVPEAEMLLFAASRAQLVREKLRPALQQGKIVIADRFYDSTLVYQGFGRELEMELIKRINQWVIGDCQPIVTFLLDMDAETAFQRAVKSTANSGEATDRMEGETLDFYRRVREAYLTLARLEPQRIQVIDAGQDPEEVFAQIWTLVEERIHGFSA